MKKIWLGGLLLANALLFAYIQWGSTWLNDVNKLQALPALHAEKMPTVSAPLATVASAKAPTTAAPIALSCWEWSDFSGRDLQDANAALANLNLGNKLSQRPIEYNSGFWVYIPPLKDRAAVAQKVAQLKARGVAEYFVVQEAGEWLHAISLGVFKTEDTAKKYLATLKEQGVNSAKLGERASKLKATVFIFTQLDDALVEQLKTLQKDFASSELKSVACR